jgi:3-methyladenine DNA glycosylase AlkD
MHQQTIEIIKRLRSMASEEKRIVLSRFFKTGDGEYAEGDCFMGVMVPCTRMVVKQYCEAPFVVIHELLTSKWHECRLCALLILVERYANAEKLRKRDFAAADELCEIVCFYLNHTRYINNWDLVDLSAPYIVGAYLLTHSRDILSSLAQSDDLWEQRIAMVSTLGLIRGGELDDTYRLAEYFAAPQRAPLHDLMQKATGWMLREMGKRDVDRLRLFLEHHATTMPRTMLRYAIEKLSPEERHRWMKR